MASPVRPATVAPGRCHGSLDMVTDSERRALRPIGMTAYEVAALTDVLLAVLLARPGIRIFQGVPPAPGQDMPRIPHAVSAGRQLVLVESVAWPPGQYTAGAGGRIRCDGIYIGQSVLPLVNAVRCWRDALPRGHQVSALVVVHPIAEGDLVLPAVTAQELAWTRADDAVRDIRARLLRRRQAPSPRAVAALVAATAIQEAARGPGGGQAPGAHVEGVRRRTRPPRSV